MLNNVIDLNDLSLEYDKINDYSLMFISKFIKNNKTIKNVSLRGNEITDKGIERLASNGFGKSTIEFLSLQDMKMITDKSTQFLSMIAESTNILQIITAGTMITKQNTFYLPIGLNIIRSGKEEIDLEQRNITDVDIRFLCEEMRKHKNGKIKVMM